MQTALSYQNNPIIEPAKTNLTGLRITERDLEILKFILEMKFSTLEEIHSMFFKVFRTGDISKSTWWARERISKLTKAGYLRPVKDLSVRTLYVLTIWGYHFLKNSLPEEKFCSHASAIDNRTLMHDLGVQKVRIALEQNFGATGWKSERALTEDEEVRKFLPKEFRPDAIYINSCGKKVSFELEISRKALKRYDDKISRYINIMQSPSVETRIFDCVHYVCEEASVAKILESKTKIYSELFKINLRSQILPVKAS